MRGVDGRVACSLCSAPKLYTISGYMFYLQMLKQKVYEIRFLISLQIIWTLSAFLKDALNLIIPDFYNKTPVLKVS